MALIVIKLFTVFCDEEGCKSTFDYRGSIAKEEVPDGWILNVSQLDYTSGKTGVSEHGLAFCSLECQARYVTRQWDADIRDELKAVIKKIIVEEW